MYDIDKITQLLGGAETLGKAVRSPLELSTMVRDGLPGGVLASLAAHLAPDALRIVEFIFKNRGSASTMSSFMTHGRFSTEQSNRIYRVAATLAHATDTLGSLAAAKTWLTSRHAFFDAAPLDRLETENGHENVQAALGCLDHGIAV